MDTVVLVLMLLIAFNFLLKQTFWKTVAVGIIATVAALFAGEIGDVLHTGSLDLGKPKTLVGLADLIHHIFPNLHLSRRDIPHAGDRLLC